MKRLLVSVLLIPSLALGAYTEFYCDNANGSNVNAGSTTSTTPTQKLHGDWVQSTGVYTVKDGTNPTAYCSVGDWVAVMVDGGTIAASVSRVSAVQNATNGTITANTNVIGSKPVNQTATATITIGGVWKGPNAASGFPFTLSSFGNNKDASSHQVRVNMKNNQTYSVTAAFAPSASANFEWVTQGYSGSVNDGGKATIDGGTSTGSIMSGSGTINNLWVDLIFSTSITSGSTDLVTSGNYATFLRCVFTGARNNGFVGNANGQPTLIECEAYANNKANGASKAGFNQGQFFRCYSHDNTGSNTSGFTCTSSLVVLQGCISDTNGGNGASLVGTANGSFLVSNCDFYNNTGDGINISSSSNAPILIENCNFIKNGGAAINNAATGRVPGYVYNCGYGAGTQANGSADTLGNLQQSGTVTYASNVTPWVDPANGDFSINLAAAEGVGRGAFTETDSSLSAPNTVGYPDIGAAQAQIGQAFPTPTATATATPTATATATATATPIQTSYAFPQ